MSSFVRIVPGVPELLEELEPLNPVRGIYPPSQDLIYQGQIPRGVFVILEGTLYLRSRRNGSTLSSSLDTDHSFGILVPSLDRLDSPMPATIATARTCDILFITRTQLRAQPELWALLTEQCAKLTEPAHSLELV